MLSYLQVHQFRNIASCELSLHPQLNWIVGINGSGKTSLLESIHCLSSTRSFRTNNHLHLISHNETNAHIFAELGNDSIIRLGVGLDRDSGKSIRINGERAQAASELAIQLPVQVITPKVAQLIEGGPSERRRFLDWGMFHVEHTYRDTLARFNRVLKQRNSLLKESPQRKLISAWDKEFIELAQNLDQSRKTYIELLRTKLEELCPTFDDLPETSIALYSGWPSEESLAEKLQDSWATDVRRAQTQYGPHRADIRIRTSKALAKDELSRGQLKLLSSAMILSQLQILDDKAKRSVVLFDDISAEFDAANRQRILQMALATGAQLFVTATSTQQLQDLVSQHEGRMFHVEHGVVTEVI